MEPTKTGCGNLAYVQLFLKVIQWLIRAKAAELLATQRGKNIPLALREHQLLNKESVL
jgi:hypothetical protein